MLPTNNTPSDSRLPGYQIGVDEHFDGAVKARGQIIPEGELELSTTPLQGLTDCVTTKASNLIGNVINELVDKHHSTVRLQDGDLPQNVQTEIWKADFWM